MARARIKPGFRMQVDRQVRIIPNPRPILGSLIGFDLQIRKFLIINGDGDSEEDVQGMFQKLLLLPESEFGSNTQRIFVARLLRKLAGSPSSRHRGLETALDLAFSKSESILQEQKEKKKMQIIDANDDTKFFCNVPVLPLRVNKFVRWETELVEMKLQQLPIQDRYYILATAKFILVFPKLKLLELKNYEYHESLKCRICKDQLSPGTEIACMPNCSHLFHEDCIQKWLNTFHMCPSCCFLMPSKCYRP